jgi:hypothetical protein
MKWSEAFVLGVLITAIAVMVSLRGCDLGCGRQSCVTQCDSKPTCIEACGKVYPMEER